jgi:hypothetical protein
LETSEVLHEINASLTAKGNKNFMLTAFEIYINRWASTILLVIGVFLAAGTNAVATTSTTSVSVTVISPPEVAIVAADELLKSASIGVLTLSIPGAGASGTGAGAVMEGMTLISTGVVGNTIVFSTTDSASLTSLVSALAASGGTFGVNGILSTGQGVHLVVTQVVPGGNGKGTVYAIIAYN